MVYQWKIPDYSSIPAQAVGEEIERCKNGTGFITPAAVVAKAERPESALHGCFEWNNDAAAEKYRLHQAGELLRNIVTVAVTARDGEERSFAVRAFVNVKTKRERGYKEIAAVAGLEDEYAYLLRCARRDLEAFEQKYAVLLEMREVLAAIRGVLT